jgi:hypothetical protein
MRSIILICAIVTPLMALLVGCRGSTRERPSPLRSETSTILGVDVHITYSSPAVRSRVIWGELVPYGKIWRTGANDATILELSGNLQVDGSLLKTGKYSLFTIPHTDQWTVIINSDWNQWGTYSYDSHLDVLRINVTPEKSTEFSENMLFYFVEEQLVFHWEYLIFRLNFQKP